MPKGFFTQGITVLLREPTTIDAIIAALPGFDIRKRLSASHYPHWALGGDGILVAYREDINGAIAVDLTHERWPDTMGDPEHDSMVFGAWCTGQFGPYTYPGNLERAAEQCWSWDGAAAVPEHHVGFIRLRLTYMGGAAPDVPIIPEGVDPEDELRVLLDMAEALLTIPAAWCYFNPNGELLLDAGTLRAYREHNDEHSLPPLDVVSNLRYFRITDTWSLMDTVGMGQFDLPDQVACFPHDEFEPDEVASFLRNISLYLMKKGDVIEDDHTAAGPGEVAWRAHRLQDELVPPPRDCLRWHPDHLSDELPEVFTPASSSSGDEEKGNADGSSDEKADNSAD